MRMQSTSLQTGQPKRPATHVHHDHLISCGTCCCRLLLRRAPPLPPAVEFAGADGSFSPVDVYVPEGSYAFGGLEFGDDMEMSFGEGEVTFDLDDDAGGAVKTFVAGQTTDKGECSVGCHDNFYTFDGRDVEEAVEVDVAQGVSDARLKQTDQTPCDTDTVVIPAGFNVNFLAIGFHAFRSVAFKVGDRVVETEAAAGLPPFMLYPSPRGSRLYLGDAIDECDAQGMMNDEDRCICASECPARDTTALSEANEIRASAKAHAQFKLRKLGKAQANAADVSFLFVGAFPAGAVQVAECTVSTAAFAAALKDAYNDQLVVQDAEIVVDLERLTIAVKGSLVGSGGVLDDQKRSFPDPIRVGPGPRDSNSSGVVGVDVRGRKNAVLALRVYHGVVQAMARKCGIGAGKARKILQGAGLEYTVEARATVFAGNNLPQIDVTRFTDATNKDGVVAAVFDAIKDMQGWTNLNRDVLYENWRLAAPGEVHKKARRAAPARMGLATSLVNVQLEYNMWQSSAGPNLAAVERRINWVLATYSLKTHHKCFSFQLGFDDDCVTAIVSKIISRQLQVCTDVDVDSAPSCRAPAIAAVAEKLAEIKGCGLLGTVSDADGKEVCADAAAEQLATVAANTTAVGAVDAAIAEIQAARAAELARTRQEERALNATRTRQAGERQDATDKRVTAATLRALKVGASELEAALKAAKAREAKARAALNKAGKGLRLCAEQWPSRVPYHANCTAFADKFHRAEQDLAVAMAEVSTLEAKGESPADRAEKLRAVEAKLEGAVKKREEQAAAVAKIEKELEDNGCERSKTDEEDPTCANLFKDLDAARDKLSRLEKELVKLRADAAAQRAVAEAEGDDQGDGDGGGMAVVVIAVVVVMVICLGVVGVVVFVMSRGSNSAKQVPDELRQTSTIMHAFVNPMYSNPLGSSTGGGDGNADLYDEPAFANGNQPGGNGGTQASNPMYMDSDVIQTAAGGYLDVPAAGGSASATAPEGSDMDMGYLDVNPEEDEGVVNVREASNGGLYAVPIDTSSTQANPAYESAVGGGNESESESESDDDGDAPPPDGPVEF